MNIKVSIIIPIYNTEKYLRQCLDSVVNQTLKEIEIICVNDGSTDNSPQILEEYAQKDKRIKVIDIENSGPGAARNTGMEYAKGEYIGFVDSDDWLDKCMYEKLYKNAKLYDSDMVMCPIKLFNNNDKIKLKHNLSYFALDCFNDSFDNCVFDSKKTKDFLFSISVTTFNKIYKTEFMERINAKFPEGLIFEDNTFFYQTYLMASRISLIRDFLYFYRVNRADSIMSSPNKNFFDVIKIENQTITNFLSLPNSQDYEMDLVNIKIFRIIVRYFEVADVHRKEFFKLIKEDFEEMNLKNNELNGLNSFNKTHYLNVLKSNSYKEFELKEKKPKISIIVPVFNVEEYICEALESLVRQSIGLKHLEVIMVDDCSTDESGRIIDEYAAKYENFKAIHLPENSGNAGKPRNMGIEFSTGDYIMFLDPDDFYADDMCEKLYNTINEENADLVFCNFNQYYPNGRLEKSYLPFFGNLDKIKLTTIDDNPKFLDIFRIWTIILKKDFIFDKNLRFDENILAEDRLFLVETFLESRGIIYLQNYYGTNYRVRSSSEKDSLSNGTSKKALMDRVDGYIKTYAILKRYNKEKYLPYALNVREFWLDRFIKSDLNSSEKEEILKKIAFLFKAYEKFEIKPYKPYLTPLFNDIVNERFNEAVLLADVLRDFINKQEWLMKEKNKSEFNKQKEIKKLKKQNKRLKRLVKTYKSRKIIKATDKILKVYYSPKSYLKNIFKQKTGSPSKNTPSKLKNKELKELKENAFYPYFSKYKEIKRLERQNKRLKRLVKTYKSRKIVKTTDKILKIYYSPKSPSNQEYDAHNKNVSSILKNKEINKFELKDLNQEIRRLEKQNKRLKRLVKTYKSRKIVKTTDKILKVYYSPKSYLKNIFKEKTTDNSKNKIKSKQRIDCADPVLTKMKSRFIISQLHKTGLKKIKDIKIAVIFDEFSYKSFKHEFNAIPIEPSNWFEIFEKEKPDLFLCESAWNGIDSREVWKRKIYPTPNKPESRGTLFNILKYCNKHGIPTIFWNKEDPTDFNTFYSTALKFDYIFTTEEECVQKYKKYGHKNVHCLMFAGQPRLFNPIEKQERSEDIVFAGSWYGRFPQRSKEMEQIFDNILDSGYKLKIYDRHYYFNYPSFKFPEKYCEFVNPAVPFDQIENVYKESKYALSINTITESNSMFSRRVFELMLSNTLVLSNYSKGMYNLFGDNVIIVGKDKIDLSNSEEKRITNLYNVLKNHTCSNRFKQILDAINYEYLPEDNTITIYYIVNSESEIKDILEHYESITHKDKKLVLIISENIQEHLIIYDVYQKYTKNEASVYPLNYFINQNGVTSNDTPYFIFADLQLEPDFVEKGILHYSYIENELGIVLGDKFTFKKAKTPNSTIFHNENFTDVSNSIFKNISIEFPVYTIKIKSGMQDAPIIDLTPEVSENPKRNIYIPSINILGSCVSRDIFNFNRTEDINIDQYIARQSFISSVDTPFSGTIDINLSSQFETRSLKSDLRKDSFKTLSSHKSDYLIIDLIEDRFPLVKFQESLFTFSYELQNSKFFDYSEIELIDKTDIPSSTWKDAMGKYVNHILKIYSPDKIIIHETYLVDQYISKNGEIKCFSGEKLAFSKKINKILKQYYDYLKQKIPDAYVISILNEGYLANENHIWGLAQVHYEDRYYQDVLKILKSIIFKEDYPKIKTINKNVSKKLKT